MLSRRTDEDERLPLRRTRKDNFEVPWKPAGGEAVLDAAGASATFKAPSKELPVEASDPWIEVRSYMCQIEPKSGGGRK